MSETAHAPEPWTHRDGRPYSTDEKINFLTGEKRDLLAQLRRQIHTSRGDGGIGRRINKIDAELAVLTKAEGRT